MTKTNTAPAVQAQGFAPVSMSNNVLAAFQQEGAKQGMWIKLNRGAKGLVVNERILPEITGRIVHNELYYSHWPQGGQKTTKPYVEGEPAPEGFETRAIVSIEVEGQTLKIDLAPTGVGSYGQYIGALASQGLQPPQVWTTLSSQVINGQKGTFSKPVWEMVGVIGQDQVEATVVEDADEVEDAEYAPAPPPAAKAGTDNTAGW